MRHLNNVQQLRRPQIIGRTRQGKPIYSLAGGSGDGEGGGGDGAGSGEGAGEGAGDAGTGKEGDGGSGSGGTDKGFPDNTPVADMTAEQQAAYWKHHARRHEQRVKDLGDVDELRRKASEFDQLKQSQMSEQEKAVEAAKAEGRAEAAKDFGARLVDAEIRAQSAGRLSDEQRNGLLEALDRTRFLTDDGEVDTDKVKTFIDGIAPAKGEGGQPLIPDLGQGRRQRQSDVSAKDRGKAEAHRRFGDRAATTT